MRKIFVFAFACMIVSAAFFEVFTVSAQGNAVLNVQYEGENLQIGNEITVYATVDDIEVENGISLIDCIITYDSSVLENISYEVNMPDPWKDYVEDEYAEDFTMTSDNQIRWTLLNTFQGVAIKEDGQLKISMVFRIIKSDANTDIEFFCKDICDDNLEPVACESKTLTIPLSHEVTASSADSADITEPQESSLTQQSSTAEPTASVDNEGTDSNENNEGESGIPTYIYVIVAVVAIAAVVFGILAIRKRKAE